MYLFSYGSNNPEQLKERLGHAHKMDVIPVYLDGYVRIFGGYSTKWKGAVASIHPCKGKKVYGLVSKLSRNDIAILDSYETGYKRYYVIVVNIETGKKIKVQTYIKNDIQYSHPPSNEYMKAISKTLSYINKPGIRKNVIPIYSFKRYSENITFHNIWMNE